MVDRTHRCDEGLPSIAGRAPLAPRRRMSFGWFALVAMSSLSIRLVSPTAASDGPIGLSSVPRFELHAPSARGLVESLNKSRGGALLAPLRELLVEAGRSSADGVDVDDAGAIAAMIAGWPDTPVHLAVFARDYEGSLRWFARVDWPMGSLHDRVAALLKSDAGRTIFEGVTLTPRGDEFVLALRGVSLARLVRVDDLRSAITSHSDLPLSVNGLAPSAEEGEAAMPPLRCRLNLAKTEADSGAVGLSSFSAVTAIDYSMRPRDDGAWDDTIRVEWPPVSGMGAKALLDRVEQTYFVPSAALGSLAVSAIMFPGMLENIAGLGPQIVAGEDGGMEMVESEEVGAIATHVDSAMSFTLLPGTGFLPFPDIVIQARTRSPEDLVKGVRAAAIQANKELRKRDRRAPWHEADMRDRAVFWRDADGPGGATVMPLSMRPVLFVAEEKDAKGKDVHVLVLGLTSTTPESFVRRWMDMPRPETRRMIPSTRKSDGELWINTLAVYRLVAPYVNISLSGGGLETLLPRESDVASSLTDMTLSAKISFSGLRVTHTGPIPAGVLAVPGMLGAATEEDRSGGTDLARERLGRQRLRLLFHHAKLFKKDHGRWPARIEELDGYVDFAGHPELLKLQVSAAKAWSDWFEGMSKAAEKARSEMEEQEEDDEKPAFEANLYVVHWKPDRWSLSFAPATFEHLERLGIDQEGEIVRVLRTPKPKPSADEAKPAPVADGNIETKDAAAPTGEAKESDKGGDGGTVDKSDKATGPDKPDDKEKSKETTGDGDKNSRDDEKE